MKLRRRKFLHLAASAVALPAFPLVASALDYPTRPVHLIVGFPAGLAPDIIGRLIAESLSERLGQQVTVDNRPGAASNIGTEIVVNAVPDGYTLLAANGVNCVNATLYNSLNFNFIRDLKPVAGIVRQPLVLTVTPSVPASTVPEFIAYAKANPGKINMGSGGIGTTPHVAGELFKTMAGVELVHVPYRTNNMPDLLSGQIQVVFAPIPAVIGYIRADKLRAIAVTTAAPSAALPGVPTVAEFIPGYEASTWLGIVAPKATPVEIVQKLNTEVNAGISDQETMKRLAAVGAVPTPMSPAEFGKLMVDETEKWAKVIRDAGIKAE
jgi:tripartite-type tricarboxylate transporter receptor subunit TctC